MAIIDDLGAILVIAVFYTETISLPCLAAAALLLLLLIVLNVAGFRRPSLYFLIGGLVWLATLGSGVHATVAGVLVALAVPARPKRGPRWFVQRTHRLVDEFETMERNSDKPLLGEDAQHEVAERVQETVEKATTPSSVGNVTWNVPSPCWSCRCSPWPTPASRLTCRHLPGCGQTV